MLVVVYLLVFENTGFWGLFFDQVDLLSPQGLLTSAALFVALSALFLLLLLPIGFRWVHKPILSLMILVAAGVSFFQLNYGVVVDTSMIQNLVETDVKEAGELMTPAYLIHMALYGVLPVVVVWLIPVSYRRFPLELLRTGLWAVVVVIVAGGALWTGYKDLSLIGREQRELRFKLNPGFAINSAIKYTRHRFATPDAPPTPIGQGSHKNVADTDFHLVVMVLGETARSANFSLAGYGRETNPELNKQDVLFFPQVKSCGTATAESLPCLFAHLNKVEFSVEKARTYENVLDVLKGSGVEVIWIDNNSGCKGVCDRVETINAARSDDPALCGTGECFDEILVKYLDEIMARPLTSDRLVVLHQKGSHGPAYYKRHPQSFTRFTPECTRASPQECSVEEIVNAYDNTILYTDFVLSQVIERLKHYQGAETSMVYVSDHGESLGEGGIYLHGLPYFLAPDEQIHVPLILWMSPAFLLDERIDDQCMAQRRKEAHSHDEIFHTLMRFFEIQSPLTRDDLDLFGPCTLEDQQRFQAGLRKAQ